ncbi:hypothetical protein [Amycolatopsis speibonae]|uniref:Uncharacterized protein n=1 Tax=Amycolatopsis speibonae TaxID=1450224 RepID=A0ABV7P3F6_9PSEU
MGADLGERTVAVLVLLAQPDRGERAEQFTRHWWADSAGAQEVADALMVAAGHLRNLAGPQSLRDVGAQLIVAGQVRV